MSAWRTRTLKTYFIEIALGNVEEREKELALDQGVESDKAVANKLQLLDRVLRDDGGAERPEVSGRAELVV